MISKQQEQALQFLSVMESREIQYSEVNRALRDLQGDFAYRLEYTGTAIQEVFDLLDSVLGDKIASYYYFEARNMKEGGRIGVHGREFPIRNIDDVRKYVDAQ